MEVIKRDAIENYQLSMILWALDKVKKVPVLPPELRDA